MYFSCQNSDFGGRVGPEARGKHLGFMKCQMVTIDCANAAVRHIRLIGIRLQRLIGIAYFRIEHMQLPLREGIEDYGRYKSDLEVHTCAAITY